MGQRESLPASLMSIVVVVRCDYQSPVEHGDKAAYRYDARSGKDVAPTMRVMLLDARQRTQKCSSGYLLIQKKVNFDPFTVSGTEVFFAIIPLNLTDVLLPSTANTRV